MLDIGGWELFVILAIALIVVGPKELPVLVRNIGRWVGKARSLARDFQSGMDEAARQADLEDVRQAVDVRASVSGEARKYEAEMRDMDAAASSVGKSVSSAAKGAPGATQGAAAKTGSGAGSSSASARPAPAAEPVGGSNSGGAAPGRASNGAAARRTEDPRIAEDEALLTDFQRGVRGD